MIHTITCIINGTDGIEIVQLMRFFLTISWPGDAARKLQEAIIVNFINERRGVS